MRSSKRSPTRSCVSHAVTICGTDLYILGGGVPEVAEGRILGHEAVGTVNAVGSTVQKLAVGDRVLVWCISSCGSCRYCREGSYGQCVNGGGWILGHLIDGTQAEYVRVPFAEKPTHAVPDGGTDEQMFTLADILFTAYEVGVLNGTVRPADVVAIIGAGPIGLAAIMTARLHSPSHIVAIDLADSRLEAARKFGADVVVNSGHDDPWPVIAELAGGLGADVTMEAVGISQTLRPSGTAGPPRRSRRQHRRARSAGDSALGGHLDQEPDHHDRACRHVFDADTDRTGRQSPARHLADDHPQIRL
jgi:alcohol dehydrogenase